VRNIQSKKGPFAQQPHFTLTEIERICSSELERVNLMPSEPGAVRIERFVEKRFGISPSYQDLPEGVLGYTEFNLCGVATIVLSTSLDQPGGSKHVERRLRTTLAHEAGHGLLHAHLFALGERPASLFGDNSHEPAILCRDIVGGHETVKKYDGRWWEYQANHAMAGLLMPRKLVLSAVTSFLSPAGTLGTPVLQDDRRSPAIRSLAEIFDVNPVVARYRLQEIFPSSQAQTPTL